MKEFIQALELGGRWVFTYYYYNNLIATPAEGIREVTDMPHEIHIDLENGGYCVLSKDGKVSMEKGEDDLISFEFKYDECIITVDKVGD